MNLDVPMWVFCVNIFLDAFVIITVPLYIVFLRQLCFNKKENISNSGFAFILFANGFWDIVSSIVYILINELPQQGIFVDFYINEPLWKGRISKAFQLGIQFFQLMSVIIVALNRWFAIKRPLTYSRIFSPQKTKYIYGILYILTIFYMLPILTISKTTIYHDDGIYYYGFQDFLFVLGYGVIAYTGLAFITFFVWIIIYMQISLYITKRGEYQKTKAKKSLTRMTAASFLFTLGTIIHFIVQVSNDIAWRFFDISNLYPIPTFFTLTRIGQEMANLSTPWVMIILLPEMRKNVKIILRLTKEMDDESRIFHVREHKILSNSVSASAHPTTSSNPAQIIL